MQVTDGINTKPGTTDTDGAGDLHDARGFRNNESWWQRISRITSTPIDVSKLLVLVMIIAMIWMLTSDKGFIKSMNDAAYARGLITCIFCFSTMGMAFFLTFQAFAVGTNDENYRRAREILAGLMGVLGTIVGFYFGSADTEKKQFFVEPVKISLTGLSTMVAGGQPPYKYSIRFTENGLNEIRGEQPADGRIDHMTVQVPKEGTIEIEVEDQNGVKASARTVVGPARSKDVAQPQQEAKQAETPTPIGGREDGSNEVLETAPAPQ